MTCYSFNVITCIVIYFWDLCVLITTNGDTIGTSLWHRWRDTSRGTVISPRRLLFCAHVGAIYGVIGDFVQEAYGSALAYGSVWCLTSHKYSWMCMTNVRPMWPYVWHLLRRLICNCMRFSSSSYLFDDFDLWYALYDMRWFKLLSFVEYLVNIICFYVTALIFDKSYCFNLTNLDIFLSLWLLFKQLNWVV